MRWYLNDASLQEQFSDHNDFANVLRSLIDVRRRTAVIHQNLRLTRSFPEAKVAPETNVRAALLKLSDKDLTAATLSWFDKDGPFVDDDRLAEVDDYFEYRGIDVTVTGLGEAARRTKAGTNCATYSFVGGEIDFTIDPLEIVHGLPDEQYGRYFVANVWQVDRLWVLALGSEPPVRSWQSLVIHARNRFPSLEIGDLHKNAALAREPFELSLSDRSLALMKLLNDYVMGRNEDGSEGPVSREIVQTYFTGERALFTGESKTNQDSFVNEMTFSRLSGSDYFAHWHGKISHRFFRMHIEWPLDKNRKQLEIFYLGPKIAKS